MGLLELGVRGLPIVTWLRPQGLVGWPAFEYAETLVESTPDDHCQTVGETMWISYTAAGLVGVAWRWSEISPGGVLISNPNDVTTNLVLVDQDLQRLETADSIRAINGLLHSLEWQAPVCDALISLARR